MIFFFVCVIYGFVVSFLEIKHKWVYVKSVGCKDKLLVMSDFSRKKNMQSNNLQFIPLSLIIWSFWLLPFNGKSLFFFFTYSISTPPC